MSKVLKEIIVYGSAIISLTIIAIGLFIAKETDERVFKTGKRD